MTSVRNMFSIYLTTISVIEHEISYWGGTCFNLTALLRIS